MPKLEENCNRSSNRSILRNSRIVRYFKLIFFSSHMKGPMIALLIIAILQILYVMKIGVFAFIDIFAIVIMYSAISGGIFSGLISACIVAAYSYYHFLSQGTSFISNSYHIFFDSIDDVILLTTALIFGIWYSHTKNNLEKLKESQEHLALAEEAAFIITSHVGIDGRILKVTPNLCKLLGYKEEELLLLNIRDITYPDDVQKDLKYIQRLLCGEIKSYDMEKRYITKTGNVIWIYINRSIVTDKLGTPLYFLTYIRDISRPKQMEAIINKSYEFNQAIIDSLPSYITVLDRTGNVVAVNDRWKEFKCRGNCSFNIGIGENFLEVHESECDKCIIRARNAVEGVKSVINGELEQYVMEYPCSASMKKMWYLFYATPLTSENGGVVISHIDITARKEMEAELVESKDQYRRLIEFLPDSAIVHYDRNIVFANATAIKTLGLTNSEDIIGTDLLDITHPDCREIVKKRVEEVIDSRKDIPPMELKVISKGGKTIDIESISTYFPYKGKPAVLVVARDITERKKTVQLQKLMEEKMKQLNEALEYDKIKTEFFANISHELRTPLNVILGTLQLIDMYTKNDLIIDRKENIGRYFKTMRQNCFRLLRLVNNLIDITKIDSGFFEIRLKNMDIVNIIEEITLSVAEYVENKSINLIFDTEIEEKIMAFDPDKIERIMLNLLSNSIKFTKPGGYILVNIYDKHDSIIISVKDTGIGIPEDKLEMIFERFRQVNKSLTRDHEGSGIGLSLVKSLVEMHEGKISLVSEYGKGSEFIIELPAKLVSESESIPENNIEQSHIERVNIEFSDIYS